MSNDPNRREARRKKILQNSLTRLRKIAHVNRENVDIHTTANDINVLAAHDPDSAQFTTRNQVSEDEYELTPLFERRVVFANASSINITFNTSRKRLLSLIFLAVLSKILSYVCAPNKYFIPLTTLDVKNIYVNSVFVPVFLYEITLFILYRNLETEYSFIQLLLVMGNMSLKTASTISYMLNVIIMVVQDLLAYFFLFTFMDLCLHVVLKRAFI